jgi:hypothetical protein
METDQFPETMCFSSCLEFRMVDNAQKVSDSNRLPPAPLLRTIADPVYEALCFLVFRKLDKMQKLSNPDTSCVIFHLLNKNKQTPWSESASELYRPSDRRLPAK